MHVDDAGSRFEHLLYYLGSNADCYVDKLDIFSLFNGNA